MKTLNSAKCRLGAHNDINGLRPRCEADRFAGGNDSFLRRNDLNDLRAAVRNRSFLTGRILSLSCSCAWSERVAQRRRFPLALLHRVPDHGRLANGGQKKLRESAATSLKRLSRVNLRAGPSDLSAGAELAAATHQPKAVIEFNSAPSSQAFVVAESGQTTVEFWRRIFKITFSLRRMGAWRRLCRRLS